MLKLDILAETYPRMEHICSRKKQTEVGNFFRDGILVNQSREQSSKRITSLTTLANRLIELILLTCSLVSFFFFHRLGKSVSISLFDNIIYNIIFYNRYNTKFLFNFEFLVSLHPIDFKYILITS